MKKAFHVSKVVKTFKFQYAPHKKINIDISIYNVYCMFIYRSAMLNIQFSYTAQQ